MLPSGASSFGGVVSRRQGGLVVGCCRSESLSRGNGRGKGKGRVSSIGMVESGAESGAESQPPSPSLR